VFQQFARHQGIAGAAQDYRGLAETEVHDFLYPIQVEAGAGPGHIVEIADGDDHGIGREGGECLLDEGFRVVREAEINGPQPMARGFQGTGQVGETEGEYRIGALFPVRGNQQDVHQTSR